MALTKVYSGGIATVANTAITGVATVAQGGTGANTFAASSAGVMGLVMYNGTNLTTDPAGNVFHVGYSEATHTMYANNISISANINVASAYNNGFAQPNATVMGLVMYNGTNLTTDPAGNVFHVGYSEATHTMYANNISVSANINVASAYNNGFAQPNATVMGLVMYNGTNLTNDPAGNVFHCGYSEATHTMYANNITSSGSYSASGNVDVGGRLTASGGMFEKANVSASALVANITLPFNNGGVLYFTQNSSANATINFTGLSGMGVGNVASFAVMVTNNTSPKYIANVQVDGDGTANITTKWSGGAPTSGTANIDTYAFNVIKTAATPTYTVLASVSNYK
jgi:hypothetical protein